MWYSVFILEGFFVRTCTSTSFFCFFFLFFFFLSLYFHLFMFYFGFFSVSLRIVWNKCEELVYFEACYNFWHVSNNRFFNLSHLSSSICNRRWLWIITSYLATYGWQTAFFIYFKHALRLIPMALNFVSDNLPKLNQIKSSSKHSFRALIFICVSLIEQICLAALRVSWKLVFATVCAGNSFRLSGTIFGERFIWRVILNRNYCRFVQMFSIVFFSWYFFKSFIVDETAFWDQMMHIYLANSWHSALGNHFDAMLHVTRWINGHLFIRANTKNGLNRQ